MKGTDRFLTILLSLVLLISAAASSVVISKRTENDGEIILLRLSGKGDISMVKDTNVEIIDHYGDLVLVRGSKSRLNDLGDNNLDINELDGRTQLFINGHNFDFSEGEPDISSELYCSGYDLGTKGDYIVHMLGPVNPEWRSKLERIGVEIINYVPNYAYHVRMTPEQKRKVDDLFFIDWIGYYQPAYKLDRDLGTGAVTITLYPDTDEKTVDEILGMVPVISVGGSGQGKRITAQVVEKGTFTELANMRDVYFISDHREPELTSETGAQILGGGFWGHDDDNNRSTPYRGMGDYGGYVNQLGYDGSGVVIGIADTGLSNGTKGSAGHPDFTGRVIGGHDFGGFHDWGDVHGHGTHCAGLIAGDTYHGTGVKYAGNATGPYYVSQGLASSSKLYMEKIFDDTGSWQGPSDYHQILEHAKRYGNCYVHSNSWGASTDGDYIDVDEAYDAGVRDSDFDSPGNQPMVVTVSAGNSGTGLQTIGSPGNAKNVITVGATEDWSPDAREYGESGYNRTNPDNVVDFSSRGWTEDGRIKPTLVAPGSSILSTSTSYDKNVYDGYTEDYRYEWMSGTSMSNPYTAGAAAVVVDWYDQTYDRLPSPAMVKALMVNGARDCDDSDGNTGPIPNKYEGWGRTYLPPIIDPPCSTFLTDQESLLTTGETDSYQVDHSALGEPMKITLTWTDKNGNAGDCPSLKNDLDLEVIAPDGSTVYRGNAFDNDSDSVSDRNRTFANMDTMTDFDRDYDGDDDVNTVECVYIDKTELQSGTYTINVIGENIPCDANNDGSPNQDYALVVQNGQIDPGSPDVTVFPSDLTVSDSSPPEGDTITIDATVSNVGTVDDATNVSVAFYDGDPSFEGTLIDKVQTTPSTIPADNGTGSAQTSWDTSGLAGYHTIYAVVDPDGILLELNEGNNTQSEEVTVEGYGIEMTCEPHSNEPIPDEALPGSSVMYDIRIKNTGTVDDTYSLSIANSPSWNVSLSTYHTSTVPTLGTETVQLTVETPGNGMPDDHAVVVVEAGSDNDPEKNASISTNTSIQPDILLVNDQGWTDSFQDSLDNIGVDYNLGTPRAPLKPYKTVIWVIGGSTHFFWPSLNYQEQSKLSDYLDSGGYLYLNAEDMGADIGGQPFYHDYLHGYFYDDDTAGDSMDGVPGDPITDGMTNYTITGYNPEWIEPFDDNATAIFTYDSVGNAGITVDTGIYKLVYIACHYFRGPDPQSNKDLLMQRILNWLSPETIERTLTAGGSSDGWHFISSRLCPRDTTIDGFLSSIEGSYDKVMSYQSPYREVSHTIWEDGFETDKGWNVSDGEWERGSPQGLGEDGIPDPRSAYSGTNVIGYDLSNDGDYEDEMTSRYATSPVINLSGYHDVHLEFQRWLGVKNTYDYDKASIEVYDGSSWVEVWKNPNSDIEDIQWKLFGYDISEYADDNPDFRIRFVMGPTYLSGNSCGWNIDELKLTYSNYEYDDNSREWTSYVPGREGHYDSLEDYRSTEGIWIHMIADDTLTIEGGRANFTKIILKQGWNMVGYPSNTTGNNGLPAEVDKIGYFDGSGPYNVAYDFDPGTFTFEPGQGYWIYNGADHSVTWTVNY